MKLNKLLYIANLTLYMFKVEILLSSFFFFDDIEHLDKSSHF